MKKLLFVLLLIGAGAFAIARNFQGPEQTMPVHKLTGTPAQSAEQFSKELLTLAQKDDSEKFALKCQNLKDRRLGVYYRFMYQIGGGKYSFNGVHTLKKQPEIVLVSLKDAAGADFTCALKQEAKTGSWKFISCIPAKDFCD